MRPQVLLFFILGAFLLTFACGGSTNDTTAPVITLTGLPTIELTVDDAYTDEGATASDDKDGDITLNIVTASTADASTEGSYTVTYNVTDTAGNIATEVVRTVNVNVITEEPSVEEPADNSIEPLFEHPNDISVEFTESVNEHDRQLITMAVNIARPVVEGMGIIFGAEIHVAGDRDSYIKLEKTLSRVSTEEATKRYSYTRGRALTYSGQVLVNVALHDDLYTGDQYDSALVRDSTLVFTVIHELYHVVQVRISEGWSDSTDEPLWIEENSADTFARRVILNAFCRPLGGINLAIAPFLETPECPREFVEENIFENVVLTFLKNPTIPSAVELYIIATFGVDAFDYYYAKLPDVAATFFLSADEDQEDLWIRTLEKTFNESSLGDLIESAGQYIEEHEEELSRYLGLVQN